jgi:hypothetical protein
MRHDRFRGFRVVGAEKIQCAVGEHNPEAEGRIGSVLFEQRDLGGQMLSLPQVSEVKPGGSATDDRDIQFRFLSAAE